MSLFLNPIISERSPYPARISTTRTPFLHLAVRRDVLKSANWCLVKSQLSICCVSDVWVFGPRFRPIFYPIGLELEPRIGCEAFLLGSLVKLFLAAH